MKKTKSLIASLAAIVVCFAMLIGTTFAWFTDSVINTNTIIKSGNIDVELWHHTDTKSISNIGFGYVEENGEEVTSSTKLFLNAAGEEILWEPGAGVGENFRIKNVGSLALKYEFRVKVLAKTMTDEGKSLTDVIKMQAADLVIDNNGVPVGGELFEENISLADNYVMSGELLAGETKDYHISLNWFSTENDNDYNVKGGLKLILGIELVATQLSYEVDGTGPDYDGGENGAQFPDVSTSVDLPSDLEAVESVSLETKSENAVSAELPAAAVQSLVDAGYTQVSLVHTEPIVEDDKIVFKAIELVDENGDVIDLENIGLAEKITVTLPAQEKFAADEQVAIYHDGEFVYMANVAEDGTISYEVGHFCEVSVKDAEKFAEPVVENGNNIEIQNLAQLVSFQQRVNAGETFSKKVVTLTNDIDMANIAWTPIGNSTNKFQGTFDGGFNTISNLKCVMEGKSNVGLFGMTTNGEIKNLTIENAIVTGRLNVGVVAGTPYTSKYNNITIIGHVEVNGMSYVGAVGGKNAYASWNNVVVNVDESSYVCANSIEDGVNYRSYVGGVIGFMGEGGHVISNVISNIDVKGSTCDVGGITGIAHYGNTFKNCFSTGDVEIFAATELDEAEEIGGIAGVWNNGGADVSILSCAFTGTLVTNVEADLSDNTLTGKAYSASGTGKLVTGEKAVVGTAEELLTALADANITYIVFSDNIIIDPAELSNAYGATGINVYNNQVLDGAGYTLDINGAGGTWDSGINITGGTIMNLTVTGSFRGIFINHNNAGEHGPVVLINVVTDGTVYTISCDQGTSNGLTAINCEFNGWTSFAATLGKARFFDCTFSEGSGYAFCRPYAGTDFIGCEFEAGFEMDPRAAVSFKNCTLAGEALTANNLATLVISNIANAIVK